jgi:hypothetical protein
MKFRKRNIIIRRDKIEGMERKIGRLMKKRSLGKKLVRRINIEKSRRKRTSGFGNVKIIIQRKIQLVKNK